MRIYLSARYGRRSEMVKCAYELRDDGHRVTSQWINGEDETEGQRHTFADQRQWALDDLYDINRSETLIAFTEPADSAFGRGGRHVEFGYAMARGLNLIVVGPRENVFHHHDDVIWFSNWHEARQYIKSLQTAA
jgi:hypothetical protein